MKARIILLVLFVECAIVSCVPRTTDTDSGFQIPEVFVGAIIGGTFGFLGVLVGNLLTIWKEDRKARRDYFQSLRLRLIGNTTQTTELMMFIESQRKKRWPYFWKKGYADLSQAHLEAVDFRNKDLRNVIFYGANLKGANLFQANLQGSDFASADISRGDFFRANLRNANFFRTNMQATKLDETDLTGASLVACNLDNASLWKSQLVGADLRFATFKSANLAGANFKGANIANVNFENAVVSATDFTGAIYNTETIWPQGFDVQAAKTEFVEFAASKRAMTKLGRNVTNLSVYKK